MNLQLKTERLLLRPFRLSDTRVVQTLCGSRNLARMTSRIPHPYPDGFAETWITSHAQARARDVEYVFCVESRGEVVGAAGLRRTGPGECEMGYWIGEPWWGRGFATEAARRLVRFAFEDLGMEKLMAGHYPDNPASGRVLEKSGFSYTGRTEQEYSIARDKEVTRRCFECERSSETGSGAA